MLKLMNSVLVKMTQTNIKQTYKQTTNKRKQTNRQTHNKHVNRQTNTQTIRKQTNITQSCRIVRLKYLNISTDNTLMSDFWTKISKYFDR